MSSTSSTTTPPTKMIVGLQIAGGLIGGVTAHLLDGSAVSVSFGGTLGLCIVFPSALLWRKLRGLPLGFPPAMAAGMCLFYLAVTLFVGSNYRADAMERAPVVLSAMPTIPAGELRANGPSATALRSWMDDQIGPKGYPSLQIAVAGPEGVIFEHTAGEPGHRSTTAGPLYPVASVSKLFTTVLTLSLAKEGVIGLDDRLLDHLPEGTAITPDPAVGADIRLRMLSNHTSGLARGVDSPVRDRDDTYDGFEPERLYAVLGTKPTRFPPGTDRAYSNLGFGTLGFVLERASGQSYETLLQNRITSPLGMSDTQVLDYTDASQTERLALPHLGGAGTPDVGPSSLEERLVGSGGIVTTASDLARLGGALLAPAGLGLSEEQHNRYFERIQLPGIDGKEGELLRQSLFGRFKTIEGAGSCLAKNGGRTGAKAYIIACPEIGFAAGVIGNRYVDGHDGSPDEIGGLLMEAMAPRP